MKILIPYDGSKNAEAALQSLQTAGFGENHEALILVADVFLPETPDEFWFAVAERRRKTQMSGYSSHVPARRRLEEEQFLLRELRERVSKMFPSWKVRVEALPGDSLASSEILQVAEKCQPDVLVIGQKSVSAAEKSGYGRGARRVAKEADCRIYFAGDGKEFRRENETMEKKATEFVLAPVRFARRTPAKRKILTAAAAA